MSIFNRSALIGGSAPTGYQIERSVRLRSSASASLSRTFPTAGNRQKWTWSGWVKRGALGASQTLFSCYYASNDNETFHLSFFSDNTLRAGLFTQYAMITNQVFRDPSAWYHIVFAFDSTQATSTDRWKLYVNGVQVTSLGAAVYPGLNDVWAINAAQIHYHSFLNANGWYFDGYLTDVNFIDGQALTPDSFGETDAVTGVWKPKKYAGTYGTNGFYLNFSDPSSTTTIGYDYSGNGNNWTSNNISVTAGVTYDSMIDTPTPYADGGNGRGNYCTLNPLKSYGGLSQANLWQYNAVANWTTGTSTFYVSSGKWYWETLYTNITGGSYGMTGIVDNSFAQQTSGNYPGLTSTSYGYFNQNGYKYNSSSGTAYGATYADNDVIGVALDMDAGTITFYKNGVSQGVAFTGLSGTFTPAVSTYGSIGYANFGQRPFAYTPPTGFKALNTQNLPEPTIVDGSQYFNAVIYTGNGTADRAIDTGLATDLFWVKQRSGANVHYLTDIVRGPLKGLSSNLTDVESTFDSVRSFTSTGVTVGTSATTNSTGQSYVAWNWKANGAGVSNTDGSITSTVSAGVTQGFSVVTYTGNGTSGATVGHGLGVVPSLVINKVRSGSTGPWYVKHINLASGKNIYLEQNAAETALTGSGGIGNLTSSTTFTCQAGASNADNVNASGRTYVAYCFAEVPGFSKFGSYTGNGSADGPFIHLGFRPRYLMLKNTSITNTRWIVMDTARDAANVAIRVLSPNIPNAEDASTSYWLADFLSNGVKLRYGADSEFNNSGNTYIYAAFAEHPFKNALAR